MCKFLPGMFKTHLYEFLTWLTCWEDSVTPGQTTGPKTNIHLRLLTVTKSCCKNICLNIYKKWVVWCLLFPLLPDVCLLRGRLLYFLWRFKVCPAFVTTACGCVRVLCVTAAICSGGNKLKDSNLVPSACLRTGRSSEVALHWNVSPSVTSSSWVLNFWISFTGDAEGDQGFCNSRLVVEELLSNGAPEGETGTLGLLRSSSWSSLVSKCRTWGAALEFILERIAEITVWNSPCSWGTEDSSDWRGHAEISGKVPVEVLLHPH